MDAGLSCCWGEDGQTVRPSDGQSAASSAPQRSQYHSVGLFIEPHSAHLSVFDAFGLRARADEALGRWSAAARSRLAGLSRVTDLRNVISSTAGAPAASAGGCWVGKRIVRAGPRSRAGWGLGSALPALGVK